MIFQDFLQYDTSDDELSIHAAPNEGPNAVADFAGLADKYKKLYKLLQSAEANQQILFRPTVTVVETLLMVLELAIHGSFTNQKLATIFGMLNIIFDNSLFPDTRYLVDSLFNPESMSKYHAVCTNCERYMRIFTKDDRIIVCQHCRTEVNVKEEGFNNFFLTLDTTVHIASLLSQHSEYYDYVTKVREHVQGRFSDIQDGRIYRQIVNDIKARGINDYATLCINADGAPVFQSSTFAIWLLQSILNEIPPQERLKSTILHGIYFGKKKPDMNVFLEPFVNEMIELADGCPMKINGENRQVSIYPICCCVDSQARPLMQGIRQWNGHEACSWCKHPGVYIGGSMRYNLGEEVYPPRTNADSLAAMDQAVRTGRPCDGFVTASQLIHLLYFGIIDGFVPDYLHNYALGTAKSFLNFWLDDAKYTRVDNPEDVFNEYLDNIKVPVQMARRARTFKDQAKFKGREYENWATLLSPPILQKVLKPRYFKHWLKLVEGMYLLLQNEIDIESIERADDLLHQFVAETEELYGDTATVYNIHQFLHMAQSVLNFGPLWCHCGYVFESGNGKLVKKIHAAKGVCSQVCRSVELAQSVEFIKSTIPAEMREAASHFSKKLNSKLVVNYKKQGQTTYFGKGQKVTNELIANFPAVNVNYLSYPRIVRKSCLYSTYLKVNRRSNNSFAMLQDGSYVQLRNFLLYENANSEISVVRRLTTRNAFEESCPMFQKVIQIDDELSTIETTNISKPCVFIDLNGERFLCAVPNDFHYS